MNDETPPGDHGPKPAASMLGARLVSDLAMGLRFYSRLPIGGLPHEAPELNRIALTLSLASIVIGAGPAALLVVLTYVGLPGIFAAGLAVAALLAMTGAMSEDGLADAADGLFGGTTPVRRLEIMRDSAHGTYGIAALVLFLLLRVAALGAVATINPLAAAGIWLGAQVLSRSGSLWLTVALPPARADGASASVGGVTRATFGGGAAVAALGALLFAGPAVGLPGLIVTFLVLAAVALGWTFASRRLVGGQTGDLIGALQALLEVAALAVLLAFV